MPNARKSRATSSKNPLTRHTNQRRPQRSPAVTVISTAGLALALVPTLLVIGILHLWSGDAKTAAYATARMLLQLLLIGYVLIALFDTDSVLIIAGVLLFMLLVASGIAIRHVEKRSGRDYLTALASIAVPGLGVLALVTQLSIGVEPWFEPSYVIPLAGMIFAGAMNAVSLAAERYQSELGGSGDVREARRLAMQAALIPITNALFAVGLVSLPGMMTGQILSGISPLVAAKYQIVVMSMLFGVSGLSAALYLSFSARRRRQHP